MTTYFVTCNPGTVRWCEARGLAVDRVGTHFELPVVLPGDTVIGTFPVNLAAQVCSRGRRYLHLSMKLPLVWREQELTMAQMDDLGPSLDEHIVRRGP